MMVPAILVVNRQRRVRVEQDEVQRFAERAVERVARLPGSELPSEIDAVLVSDRKITRLHHDFMGSNTPTDVITFQHGEIVISVDTAARQAREYETSFTDEVKLYLLHGLLHLKGYDDLSAAAHRQMMATQTRLFNRLITRRTTVTPRPQRVRRARRTEFTPRHGATAKHAGKA